MKKTKTIFTKIIVALVLCFSAIGVILPNVALAATELDCDIDNPGLQTGVDCAKTGDQADSLFGNGGIITRVINTILFVVGILSVIMIIYGGIKYSTSGGDAPKVTSAKNTIMYAIIGLIVAILSYAIVNFIIANIATSN